MSTRPHAKPKLTSTGAKSGEFLYHTVYWSGNNPGGGLHTVPRRPVLPLFVTSAPCGHTFSPFEKRDDSPRVASIAGAAALGPKHTASRLP